MSELSAPDRPITLFTFGYWGNGSATAQLVEAVDAAEQQRGFGPPRWVDIRISRSVRAVGFRDDAFARLLGSRYVWMRELGNLRVEERGTGIEIKNPAAANELLDLAIVDPTRRVIFFCACERPAGCHRHVVGKLAVAAARSRGVDATVVEWPGGEPLSLTMDVLAASFRSLVRGTRRRLPVPASLSLGEATALPWASTVVFRSGGREATGLVGPARFDIHGPHLPIVVAPGDEGAPQVQEAARQFRREHGYMPLR